MDMCVLLFKIALDILAFWYCYPEHMQGQATLIVAKKMS